MTGHVRFTRGPAGCTCIATSTEDPVRVDRRLMLGPRAIVSSTVNVVKIGGEFLCDRLHPTNLRGELSHSAKLCGFGIHTPCIQATHAAASD